MAMQYMNVTGEDCGNLPAELHTPYVRGILGADWIQFDDGGVWRLGMGGLL